MEWIGNDDFSKLYLGKYPMFYITKDHQFTYRCESYLPGVLSYSSITMDKAKQYCERSVHEWLDDAGLKFKEDK